MEARARAREWHCAERCASWALISARVASLTSWLPSVDELPPVCGCGMGASEGCGAAALLVLELLDLPGAEPAPVDGDSGMAGGRTSNATSPSSDCSHTPLLSTCRITADCKVGGPTACVCVSALPLSFVAEIAKEAARLAARLASPCKVFVRGSSGSEEDVASCPGMAVARAEALAAN
jgi:hypothetical protein